MENPCHRDNLYRPLPQWHIQFLVLMDPAWESRRGTWPLQRPWKIGVTFILKDGSGIHDHLVSYPILLLGQSTVLTERCEERGCSSLLGGYEAEEDNARTLMPSFFSSLIPSGPLAHGTLPLTSRVNLSPTTSSLLEPPSQTIQRSVPHQSFRWF